MAAFHRLPSISASWALRKGGLRLASAAGNRPLRSHGAVNVGLLAAAMKAPLARGESCAVDAVGPMAQLKALKAMFFASDYLEEERPGFRVAGEPRSELVPASENHPETTKVRLVLSLVPESASPRSAEEIRFGKESNPGTLAATIAQKIKLQGRATLSAMGPIPASKALKSVMLARQYLHEHLGDDAILVVPAKQVLPPRPNKEETVRLLLACLRGPKSPEQCEGES
ncbi:unnamed protein product [Symbiodinium natans]|uniref:Uncharacterized protein n=1 Tax=Symbiodinium natans TaxID=878477 RepID=A0A812TGA0_9DINO|nr:unnamed protein product [Symbiodinium natans]